MNKPLSSVFISGLPTGIVLVLAMILFSCSHPNTIENKNRGYGTKNGDSAGHPVTAAGQTGSGEIISDTLGTADLPASITYKGKPVKVMSWNDKLGDNLLLLTETGEFASADSTEYPDNRDAELHVYHYVKAGSAWQKIATINDQINSCPVDIVTRFVPGALFITDLDGNGIAEATFAYQLTCTGGVDNKVMKLIMLENKKKYVIRGTTTVDMGEKIPGTMKYEAEIPAAFKIFMIKQWKAFETEHLH